MHPLCRCLPGERAEDIDLMEGRYRERHYRRTVSPGPLVPFTVTYRESDLFVLSRPGLPREALEALKEAWGIIEKYGLSHPPFLTSLEPLATDWQAHPLVTEMMEGARAAGVGPMAAVAGAVAEYVGKALLCLSTEVIVENGGDIFISSTRARAVRIFTDNTCFGDKVVIEVDSFPAGLCTSSGVIGPSLSFGRADAASVLSPSAALADAAATALGNLVKTEDDVEEAIEKAKTIEGVKGIVVIIGRKIGLWGDLRLAK
ncbi:MAG: UPF0280 family protein [Candidatus Eremiobacteraeota bacterium]|nr:UPF0280 family protein [Candidatus Eremiobacteraeota bacterium]